ncbi:MAG: hypothetical protein SOY37_01900 [Oscillospiraceae bacterium]|nr:hypothetical protein [Oscillospiraceae bacterium]
MKHTETIRAWLPLIAALTVLGAMLCHSDAAMDGARSGLAICANLIVPSLFPFFVLSFLLNRLGLPSYLGRVVEPAMKTLFGVSGAGASAFLIGITGGYPLGAACIADLRRQGEISEEDGNRLLPFCNNSGPAFIIGAAGVGIFHSGAVGLSLYFVHVLSALITGLFLSGKRCTDRTSPRFCIGSVSLSRALPEAIRSAVRQILTVCGFVVTFSTLTYLLDDMGVFSAIYGHIAAFTGYELRLTRAFLTGILELGCGVGALAGAAVTPVNLAVCAFLIGFGGISVAMQTAAVLDGTNIKVSRHLVGRLLNGSISAFLIYTLGSAVL